MLSVMSDVIELCMDFITPSFILSLCIMCDCLGLGLECSGLVSTNVFLPQQN